MKPKLSILKHKKLPKLFYLLLTIFAGIIILLPSFDYLPFLSVGDHGRDLYSFQRTLRGDIPYQDYWSQNGPLMPYYFSTFYKLSNVSIQSTLWAYNLLVLLIGIFIFLACSSLINPLMSFLCSLWYWSFRDAEFFYTFNHIGAIFFMVLVLYCCALYLKKPVLRYAIKAAFFLFLMILIRPNIGVACCAAFFLSLFIFDLVKKHPDKRKHFIVYILLILLIGFSSFAIYYVLTHDLPQYVRSHELAYWKKAQGNHVFHNLSILSNLLTYFMTQNLASIAFSFLLLLVTLNSIVTLKKHSYSHLHSVNLILFIMAVFLFIATNIMEFFFGNFFWTMRWSWVLCPFYIALFIMLAVGSKNFKPILKNLFYLTLFAFAITYTFDIQKFILANKNPLNYFETGENKIYLTSDQYEWIRTVQKTSTFINTNIPKEEKFLAFPYMPLYYFLSEKKSPVRDLSFLNLAPEKEKPLIAELERQKINYILFSNRALYSSDKRFGKFGQDYGRELAIYFQTHFKPVATFGRFYARAGWINNHAVSILKRTPSF